MGDRTLDSREQAQGVVDKVALILMAFTFDQPEMDLREVARRVNLNKSTACRLLKKLASYHLIEQNPASGLYRLGIRLFELGSLAADNLKIGEAARPYLEELTALTGEASHFAILDESAVVHLVRVESPKAIRAVPCRLGERYPFHCLAAGKAIAAFLSHSDRLAMLSTAKLDKHTENTITSRSDLELELQNIRDSGYALDDEEFIKGIKCIAAPIQGYKGRVIGAVNLVGPAVSLTAERISELTAPVLDTASRLSSYFSKDIARCGRVL